MNVDNNTRDIVGSLRTIYLIILIANIPRIRFPLDPAIAHLREKYFSHLKQSLDLVWEFCQKEEGLYAEFSSAIRDILHPLRRDFYDEATTTMLLNFYIDRKTCPGFAFDSLAQFHQELRPIIVTLLCDLIDAMLGSRAKYYDINPHRVSADPRSLLVRFFEIVAHLIPSTVELPPPDELMALSIQCAIDAGNTRMTMAAQPNTSHGRVRLFQELMLHP
jgi:hypothetical protein